MKFTRFTLAGIAILALGGLLLLVGSGMAGGEQEKLGKEIDKLAEAIKKGDAATAKKIAKEIAEREEEVYYPMLLFKPRKEGSKSSGYGVGKKDQNIIPDGIELKIRAMARDLMSGAKLAAEKDALIEMAYRTAAINHIAKELPPSAKKAQWMEHADVLEKATMDLVKAVTSGSTAEVKTAATKMNTSCNNCHSDFR